MKLLKQIFRLTLLLLISICFSSCSWGVLLFVGNNLDKDIKISYKLNDTKFLKEPKTYSFDENLLKLYKNDVEKWPVELTNNSEYNDESKIVTLTIKPGQASYIGGYASFESFTHTIDKSELKIIIGNDSILKKEKLIEFSQHKRKINVLKIN